MQKIPQQEIDAIVAATSTPASAHDRDEMAIPSYQHSNPLIRWLMWRRYETIATLLEAQPGETAFEFGCGLGLFLSELNRRYGRVYATDLFMEFAKALNDRRGLATEFVELIDDVPDESLDIIVAADVLEHIEDLPAFLAVYRAKLKPSGRLLISGPTENWVYKIGRIIAGFGDKGDYHHTNVDGLIDTISENGFRIRRSRSLPFAFAPTLFKVCEFTQA